MNVNVMEKNLTVSVSDIQQAYNQIRDVVYETPLKENRNLSEKYSSSIYFKREDLQVVRSYKIRGAFNKISSLSENEKQRGVVCASAGNHAQGFAYSCSLLKIFGKIYMPTTTPMQKIRQVEMFGRSFVEIIIFGDTFDDSYHKALEISRIEGSVFVHPFDDIKVISGQGTTAIEVFKQYPKIPDYVFVPIGGGGFASGVSIMLKHYYPNVKIIGVEPQGASSMSNSFKLGKNVGLETIDGFVDGAAVKRVGDLAFDICRKWLDDVVVVPEGKVCSTILSLYNEDAIVVEPAGALSVAALDFYKSEIKNKNVICFISGGNNDITRTEEFRERSMLYEGLKHYFIIRFPQRAGALREFLIDVLGVNDDITHFEYVKKNNRDAGPAVIGIELKNKNDFEGLIERLDKRKINYQYLNKNADYLQYLI